MIIAIAGENKSKSLKAFKECSVCGIDKSVIFFSKDNGSKDGLDNRCSRCQRNEKLLRRYGITLVEYEALLLAQADRCACCRNLAEKTLCVDHDHLTGKIRGLLCDGCNRSLGSLGDSVEGVEKALAYLQNVR